MALQMGNWGYNPTSGGYLVGAHLVETQKKNSEMMRPESKLLKLLKNP